jgi:hypothetical protein
VVLSWSVGLGDEFGVKQGFAIQMDKATGIEYEKIDSAPRELPVQSRGVHYFAGPVFFVDLQSFFNGG